MNCFYSNSRKHTRTIQSVGSHPTTTVDSSNVDDVTWSKRKNRLRTRFWKTRWNCKNWRQIANHSDRIHFAKTNVSSKRFSFKTKCILVWKLRLLKSKQTAYERINIIRNVYLCQNVSNFVRGIVGNKRRLDHSCCLHVNLKQLSKYTQIDNKFMESFCEMIKKASVISKTKIMRLTFADYSLFVERAPISSDGVLNLHINACATKLGKRNLWKLTRS